MEFGALQRFKNFYSGNDLDEISLEKAIEYGNIMAYNVVKEKITFNLANLKDKIAV